jgi:hypothetical protein
MKRWMFLAAALLLVVACKVEKTGDDTYKVETTKVTAPKPPTARELKTEAKELGTKIKQEAHEAAQSEAGKQITEGAKEVGNGLKKGAGNVAVAAGDALKRAGEKAQSDKPDRTTTHR